MNPQNPVEISGFLREIVNDDFAVIAFVTFLVCEAVFNAFPIHQARMKQLTAILVGGFLGIMLLDVAIVDAFLQGLLAGGAATVVVAKFKKPSASATDAPPPPVSAPPAPEPVEHI